MIPQRHIIAWRSVVPWVEDAQVEQDLVLSRAIVALFQQPILNSQLVMRGGTAFNKLILSSPARYSEDIDLVMREEGPIGTLIDAVRSVLDPWLGSPRRDWRTDRLSIKYRFDSSEEPARPMRLKIEINPVEHLAILHVGSSHFEVDNPWFSGSADVPVYHADEMFGSKMHALYHRKKGRDLFDLWLALDRNLIDATSVVQCFQHYSEHQDNPVSRAQFEANLLSKFQDRRFHEDLAPLLSNDTNYDPGEAIKVIMEELISRLPGDPWQGEVEPVD